MFAALASILGPNQTLDVSVTNGADGTMKVVLKPQLAKGANAALALPLALVATAQELDAEFITILMQYAAERTSLQQQVNVTATIIAQAKESEVGKATKAIKSGSKVAKAASAVSDNGDDSDNDGDGENTLGGDDVLDDAPVGRTAPSTPSAPVVKQIPAPAADSHDDLLSLMS